MKDQPTGLVYYAADLGESVRPFVSVAHLGFYLAYLGHQSADWWMEKLFDGIAPFGGPPLDCWYGPPPRDGMIAHGPPIPAAPYDTRRPDGP